MQKRFLNKIWKKVSGDQEEDLHQFELPITSDDEMDRIETQLKSMEMKKSLVSKIQFTSDNFCALLYRVLTGHGKPGIIKGITQTAHHNEYCATTPDLL